MDAHPSNRWVEAQRATPSFTTAQGSAPTVLDMPLPGKLGNVHGLDSTGGGGSPAVKEGPSPSARRAPRRSATPGKTIYEDLLERGKMYEQRKEALRERAIHGELKQCRKVPKISALGHNIERTEKIVNRLYKVQLEKEKLAEYRKLEIDARDDAIIASFFKPKLSRRGGRAAGKTMSAQHDLWDFKRQERLEELRREKILRELENIHDAPEIDPRSAHLAAKRREKEGLAGYSHYEAMLERDRLSKLAKWETEQMHLARTCPMSPQITPKAARLEERRAGEDIAERLYNEGKELERRKAELVRRHMEEEDIKRRSGSLGLNSARRDPDRLINAGEDVLERNMRYVHEKEERIRQTHEMERRMHNPNINPVSDAIASRLPQSTMERLTTPSKMPRAHSATPSRTPFGIDATNEASASGSPPGTSYTKHDLQAYERLMREEERRQVRLQQAKRALEEREKAECSFQPHILPYSAAHLTGSGASAAGPPSSVYERNQAWLRRRDERLQQQRAEQQRVEQDQPFSPFINPNSTQIAASIPGGAGVYASQATSPPPGAATGEAQEQGSGPGYAPGFADFLKRQAEARQQAEARYIASTRYPSVQVPPTGTTTPEEFHFRTDPNSEYYRHYDIHALQPPIIPPKHHATHAAGGEDGGIGVRGATAAPAMPGGQAHLSSNEVRALAERLIMGKQRQPGTSTQQAQQPPFGTGTSDTSSGVRGRYVEPDPQAYGVDDNAFGELDDRSGAAPERFDPI